MSSKLPASPPEYSVGALEAGITVLNTIGAAPGQTVPQLARQLDMTKSKVYRVVRTLKTLGYVHEDENHALSLGRAAFLLGQQAQEQHTLLRASRAALDRLEQETRENVYLVVREGTHGLILDVRHSPHPVRAFARVGSSTGLHAGGAGKVLLAYAPAEVQEQVMRGPLERYTPDTVTDPKALRQVLEEVRKHEAHLTLNDLQEQVFALATPVRNRQGEVIAALSIAGPRMRFDQERQTHYSALLLEASQQISRELGGE